MPLHPSAPNPAASFEAIPHVVERRNVKLDCAARVLLDEASDFVAVTRAAVEQGEDEQFRASLFQFAAEFRVLLLSR
jgi:hypothetical protein